MSNEKFTQLPTVANATAADIICAVQGGVSVQETLQQVLNLVQSGIVLNFAGNPNGNVAGVVYNLCYDTTNHKLYICTTTGSTTTAVWTLIGAQVVAPVQGGTGVSNPTAHTIPVAEGSSNYTYLALTNGQLLIGSTGADPVPSTLTAGAGVSLINAAGSITISSSGGQGYTWNEVTGTSASMSVQNAYIANNVGLVTLTLPPTAVIGSTVVAQGKGSGLFTIAQNSGQTIHVGSSASTPGVGGSVASTNQYDSIALVCITANTTWATLSGPEGNFTVT